MAKRSGKDAAANDDIPTTPKQKGLPHVFENVKKIPALEEACEVLADKLDAFNEAKIAVEKVEGVIEGLLKKHDLPAYALKNRVMVGLKNPEGPKLYVKRLKAPTKADGKTAAA